VNIVRITYALINEVIARHCDELASLLYSSEKHDVLHEYPDISNRQLSVLGRLLLFLEAEQRGLPLDRLPPTIRNRYGKPDFTPADAAFRFSVAHSGLMAVLATSENQRVGIDIEPESRGELPHPASVFTTDEQVWVGDNPKRFLTLWTRKEAVLKADGRGLSLDPSSFDVLNYFTTLSGTAFYVRHPEVSAGYVCAIAFEKKDTKITTHRADINETVISRIRSRL
jgi:4'-phosphopantetheinyl transferase